MLLKGNGKARKRGWGAFVDALNANSQDLSRATLVGGRRAEPLLPCTWLFMKAVSLPGQVELAAVWGDKRPVAEGSVGVPVLDEGVAVEGQVRGTAGLVGSKGVEVEGLDRHQGIQVSIASTLERGRVWREPVA
jgi:hypothetical protein